MRTRASSIVFFLTVLVLSACTASRKPSVFEQLAVADVVEAEVIEFTSRKAYPGMESNLIYTEHFTVVWKATFHEPAEVVAILSDSMRMAISYLNINGEMQRAPFSALTGVVDRIECYASRNIYREPGLEGTESNQSIVLSPALSAGEHYLECHSESGVHWVLLPNVTRLESTYAP